MSKSDEFQIAFICDDNYIIPTIVSIQSLINSKKSKEIYRINIITTSLEKSNIQLFKNLETKDVKISVTGASVSKYEGIHKQTRNSYCVATTAALLKFDLPNILKNSDRVLYLDGDIIVRDDVYEILTIDLKDNYVAAVKDSGNIYTRNKTKLCYSKYFNSGVMLLNLVKMRKDNITEKLIETKKSSQDMSLMDQNIFNEVFDGKIELLQSKWNVLYVNMCRAKKDGKLSLKKVNAFYETNYRSFREIYKTAGIIHYASADKPWKYYNAPLVKLWDRTYKVSPVKNIELNRNKTELWIEKKCLFLRVISELTNNGLKKTFVKILQHLEKNRKAWWKKILWKIMSGSRKIYIRSRFQLYKIPARGGFYHGKQREHEIIVSLTTIPFRIKAVPVVIGSMMRQTVKPDRIQLYLGEEEFKNKKLPLMLRWQQKCGLEIVYCKDLKPHTKYFYAMQKNPAAVVITIDDDILYYKDTIECLYNSFTKFPNCISALRTHLITFNDKNNEINPYNIWRQRWSKLVGVPHMRLFATGVGGVLYPPRIMHQDLLHDEIFMELCPFADDLWLKAMQVLNNVPCVLAREQRALRYIDHTQEVALLKSNVGESKNDVQLGNIVEYYRKKNMEEGEDILERMRVDKTPVRNRDLMSGT